ncbi:YaeQ family protein [Saltatorellus ferox]|uniref:YaeQ family protein n=1 Tax=Saltatorellus ferox TaxID=2528018 RepID=UPI003AF3903B
MGTTSTIYRFQVDLSDIDRGVYETLDLRVARHASEDDERMVVRVLARVLAHEEGMEFGRGLSDPNDAGLWTHDHTGQVVTWIDVGLPAAERLHRASKHCPRVLIFTHKPEEMLLKEWRSRKIHRADKIEVHQLPAEFVEALAKSIERRNTWYVTIHDHVLSVGVGDEVFEGHVDDVDLESFVSTAEGT